MRAFLFTAVAGIALAQTQALECGYVRIRTGALNITSSGSGCKIPMTWQISGDAGVQASTTDVHYLVDESSNMLSASYSKIKPFIKLLNAQLDTAGVFNTSVGANNTGRLGYGQVLYCYVCSICGGATALLLYVALPHASFTQNDVLAFAHHKAQHYVCFPYSLLLRTVFMGC
jgi:hypothetical protein